MSCPTCKYVMDPFEPTCPRCAREEESLFEEVVQVEEISEDEETAYDLSKYAEDEQPFILPPEPDTDVPATITPAFSLNELEIDEDGATDQIEKSCEQIVQPFETEDEEEKILDLSAFDETKPLPKLQASDSEPQTTIKTSQHILTPPGMEDGPSNLETAYEQVIQTDDAVGDDILDLTGLQDALPK